MIYSTAYNTRTNRRALKLAQAKETKVNSTACSFASNGEYLSESSSNFYNTVSNTFHFSLSFTDNCNSNIAITIPYTPIALHRHTQTPHTYTPYTQANRYSFQKPFKLNL